MKHEKAPNIAICQLPLYKGTREDLFFEILNRDKEFQAQKVDLVVYPWTYFGIGYGSSQDLFSTGTLFFHGWLQKLAAECTVPTLLPFNLVTQDGMFSDIALLNNGNVSMLFSDDVELLARPEASLEVGVAVFSLAEMDFGVAYEEDSLGMFTNGSENVDAILYIPASGINISTTDYGGFFSYLYRNLQGIAKKANVYFIEVNGVGLLHNNIFSGLSFVLSPTEQVLAVWPFCESHVSAIELSDQEQRHGSILLPKNVDFFSLFPYPLLVRALQDFVYQGSFRGVELLITGDLPTSFAATLAVDALGPKNVCVVRAPVSSQQRNRNMDKLIKRLGVEVEELTKDEINVCRTYEETRIPFFAGAFTFERARSKKYCRITAEDQTALALGQDLDNFPDSDFSPFSEFLRTELARQAKERNKNSKVIPDACFSEIGLNYSGSRLYKIISDGFKKAPRSFLKKWEAPSILIDNVFYAYLNAGMSEEVLYAENPDIAAFAPHILRIFKKYAFLHDKLPFSLNLSFPENIANFYPIMGAWQRYDAKGVTEADLLQEANAMGQEIVDKLEAFFSKETQETEEVHAQEEIFDTFNDFVLSPLSNTHDEPFFGNGLMGDN